MRYPLLEPEQPIARDQVDNFTVKYEGKSPSGVEDEEINHVNSILSMSRDSQYQLRFATISRLRALEWSYSNRVH